MCEKKVLIVALVLAVMVIEHTDAFGFLGMRNKILNMMPKELREKIFDKKDQIDPKDIDPEEMRNMQEKLSKILNRDKNEEGELEEEDEDDGKFFFITI